MKKGISLIVLVITIIVMIILAAAIIISISNSNVINKATQAVSETNIQSVKDAASIEYADAKLGTDRGANQTISEYIEEKLISSNTISSQNPYIFTNQGGAYYIPEYDVTSNTKRDYRVINGELYYFGTDIAKRKALKDNTDINTDYIFLYTDMDVNKDKTYKLSDIEYLNKVSSFEEITNNDINSGINSSSVGSTDDVTLTNGIKLTLKETYNSQPIKVQVIVYGDTDFDGMIFVSADDYILISYIRNVLDSTKGMSLQSLINDLEIVGSYDAIKFMYTLTCDVDMDGDNDNNDLYLGKEVIKSINSGLNDFTNGLTIKEMTFYNSLGTTGTDTKSFYDSNLMTYKKIYRFPADIAK